MKFKIKGKVLILILLMAVITNAGCITISPITPTLTRTSSTQSSNTESTTTAIVSPNGTAESSEIPTISVEAITSSVPPYRLAEYPSSDHTWSVAVDRYECSNLSVGGNTENIAYEQIRLIDLSTRKETVIADQIQNCSGLGAFGFKGLYWSPSNQYFYYNDSREGQPDGGCGNYIDLPMYQLNVETNKVLMLDRGFISPDQAKVAMWRDHKVVIWDLDKGELGEVAPIRPSLFSGKIWWSQKSDSVLFLQTENACAPDFGTSYVSNLDLRDFSQEVIANSNVTGVANYSFPPSADEFILASYPPLVLNYDPLQWQDESLYNFGDSTINYLQTKDLTTCRITVLKFLTIKDHHSSKIVRIGRFNFTITTLDEPSPDFVNVYYAADQFIEGYNLSHGAPIFKVGSLPAEWKQCQALAEEVLSTLHPTAK